MEVKGNKEKEKRLFRPRREEYLMVVIPSNGVGGKTAISA
jgi:hypothetical protein